MLGFMTATSETLVTVGGARDRARWVMLIVLLCGQFMALLDVTIVNVAMPTIGRSLHASGAELQLVIAGYTVSYAMLLITGARLGDLIGRRRMFLLGVAGFSLASLACGLAPNVGVLIAARFVQGAAAAAMMPQIMTVIQLRFSGAERARALSAYTAILSSGFVAGQVIGGLLVTADLFGASWRPVFLVNVPIGLAVLLVLPRVMPADVPGRSKRLDLPGLLVAVPAVCLVVLPLMLGHQENWPAWSLACIGAGLALVPVFLYTERTVASRGGHPLLSVAVFRAPGLVPGLAAMTLLMVTYGGFLFSFAIHLQAGLGDSALRAGLTFAPCAVAFGVVRVLLAAAARVVAPVPDGGRRGRGSARVPVGGAAAARRRFRRVLASAGARGALRSDGGGVQPAGHAGAGPGAAARGGGRQRRADDGDPAEPGGGRGGARQPVPDAGRAAAGARAWPPFPATRCSSTLAWVAVTLACGALAAVPLARTVRAAAR